MKEGKMREELLRALPLGNVKIDDRFWNNYIRLVSRTILPHMWELINDRVPGAEKSFCVQNFRIAAGEIIGTHHGAVFQDTDLTKWLEAVAYSLASNPDPELEKTADGAIDLIGRAQCDDGYIVTYYIITGKPRWSDLLEGHELYTAGHLIEAACAYFETTGKRKLLDIACRFADCIDRQFGREEGKMPGYPGHPEIELALIRLYHATGEKRYLRLADYFIRERGRQPSFFDTQDARKNGIYLFREFEDFGLDYMQADRPLSSQREAEGHAVRAGYLYSGMADLAAELKDGELFSQCEVLFSDITEKKMYVTGSIGSAAYGERFTSAYDLPNDTNYSETCATISLAMFANRMFRATGRGRYADTVETALYNTLLSGISLDGRHFFYVNPLEVDPDRAEMNPTMRHVKTTRQAWFGCACCPPNIARTLASMGNYMFAQSGSGIYINLFISSEARAELAAGELSFRVRADYPASGHVEAEILSSGCGGEPVAIALRRPGYTKEFRAFVNGLPCGSGGGDFTAEERDGYLFVTRAWKAGDVISADMDVDFRFVYANPNVPADIGKAALMKGPWAYCLEEKDNGKHLSAVFADTGAGVKSTSVEGLPEGVPAAGIRGLRAVVPGGGPLYAERKPEMEEAEFTAVPYCLWNNRGRGEMAVWMKTV